MLPNKIYMRFSKRYNYPGLILIFGDGEIRRDPGSDVARDLCPPPGSNKEGVRVNDSALYVDRTQAITQIKIKCTRGKKELKGVLRKLGPT